MRYCCLLMTLLLPLPWVSAANPAFEAPQVLRLTLPPNTGELYPRFADIDGSGRPTLLVGTTGGGGTTGRLGRLMIYPTTRRGIDWQFGRPAWFDDAHPTGLIGGG